MVGQKNNKVILNEFHIWEAVEPADTGKAISHTFQKW